MDSREDTIESQVSRIMYGTLTRDVAGLTESLASLGMDGSQSEDYDLDLELQDFSDDTQSDYSYEEEEESEVTPQMTNGHAPAAGNLEVKKPEGNGVMALVPLEDDGEDIDSEEERDLMKEIRDEIQNKVKEEMKDELQVYKAKLEAIEQGAIPGDEERNEKKKEQEENLDPKIKEALIKMRKLDRILTKKLKREREVKRDRIILERRIREEIENIKPEGREHKEVKVNTDKFVALALPPSHNEGVPVEPPPATPVFQTQLNESEFRDRKHSSGHKEDGDTTGINSEASSVCGDTETASSRVGEDGRKGKRKKRKKDFIKRNKELAANADEAIAMTEEERKRVGELLTDLDSLAELPEEMTATPEDGMDENPYQMLPIKPGEGYYGDTAEQASLARIDSRLRSILPEEEYNTLVVAPQDSARDQHKLFTRVDVRSVVDIERYGERALIETKEQREMKARLDKIEEELARFNNPDEIEIESPGPLSEHTLKGLIDQCVRSLSRSSYTDNMSVNESTPRSEVSSVVSVLDNPPRLSDEVLQRLLAEAHFPLSSKLEALREDEEEESEEEAEGQEGTNTEEGIGRHNQQIRAETWKTIAEQDINRTGHDMDDDLSLESLSRHSSHSTLRSCGPYERHYMDLARKSLNNFEDPPESRLVLPEISHSPFLVSQGLNNQVPKNEANYRWSQAAPPSGRNSIDMVRNNLADNGGDVYAMEKDNDYNEMMMPRPPTSERRPNTGQSSGSSRTVTPLTQTS